MKTRAVKTSILSLLMRSSSLHDLLFILKNICQNLDLQGLNPKMKQFQSFRFTFFGLLSKARGTLQIMLLHSEQLAKTEGMNKTYEQLLVLQKLLAKATTHLQKNQVIAAQKEIITIANVYEDTFNRIQNDVVKLL